MKQIWECDSIKEAATRPEFYQFLNSGLKTTMLNAYKETPSTYEQIVDFETSTKDKESYPSLGNIDLPEQVLESEAFPRKNIPKNDYVEITNLKYGSIIEITRELIDDDQTKKVKDLPKERGVSHKKKEDKTVYSIINGSPVLYDAQSFFSLNHPGYTGGGAIGANDNIYTSVTMSANALAVAISMIALWTGFTSEDILDIQAKFLLVPARLKYTANLLTQSDFLPLGYAAATLGPAATTGNGKNVLRDLGLRVFSSPRLDGTSVGDWYVRTNMKGFIFQVRDQLELYAAQPNTGEWFNRDVLQWKDRKRWATKVVNWRTMMKVS